MRAKLMYLSIFYLDFRFIVVFILPITLRSFKSLIGTNGLSFVCPTMVQVCRKRISNTFSPYSIEGNRRRWQRGMASVWPWLKRLSACIKETSLCINLLYNHLFSNRTLTVAAVLVVQFHLIMPTAWHKCDTRSCHNHANSLAQV